MTIDEVIADIESLQGVLALRPQPGDGTPEIAWGDSFFYYAPDGVIPQTQPFATIITKDYPDDAGSRLGRPGAFRVNVAAGSSQFRRWTGHEPRDLPAAPIDPVDDVVLAHPVYGELGWLCVTNPGPHAGESLLELVRSAHAAARARHERRESL